MTRARKRTVAKIIAVVGVIGLEFPSSSCGSPQQSLGSRAASSQVPQAAASGHAADAATAVGSSDTRNKSADGTLLPPPMMAMVPTTPMNPARQDDSELSKGNACGTGSVSAELTPVNMLVMFDRSNSMEQDGKWQSATAALTTFFQDPSADGLGVALRFFPHDEPAVGCTMDACDAMACAQPLVDIDVLQKDPSPMDAQEDRLIRAIGAAAPMGRGGGGRGGGGGGTPIYAALDGALRWATQHQAAKPAQKTVVIFVTDGEPNGCDENFDNIATLASDALSAAKIPTYAIGLEGSSEAQMDQLAAAGGTDKGIFIGSGANAEQQLLAALNTIRGAAISCDFPLPAASSATQQVDVNKLNVTFTPGHGSAATFRRVPAEAECKDLGAWYYDAPAAPQRIVLCPTACQAVQKDAAARIEILIGCTTCGGLDESCDQGTPPEVPPLF